MQSDYRSDEMEALNERGQRGRIYAGKQNTQCDGQKYTSDKSNEFDQAQAVHGTVTSRARTEMKINQRGCNARQNPHTIEQHPSQLGG